jgi:hypothetical protein
MALAERSREYSTTSLHLAEFLLYVLGNNSHRSTIRFQGSGPNARFQFTFDDSEDRCRTLEEAFFEPEGAAVENAKSLLICGQAIKNSIRLADRDPEGMWWPTRTQGEQDD